MIPPIDLSSGTRSAATISVITCTSDDYILRSCQAVFQLDLDILGPGDNHAACISALLQIVHFLRCGELPPVPTVESGLTPSKYRQQCSDIVVTSVTGPNTF